MLYEKLTCTGQQNERDMLKTTQSTTENDDERKNTRIVKMFHFNKSIKNLPESARLSSMIEPINSML